MLPTIYILSGLGADERVFQRLDLSAYHVIHIKWITPLHKETIENYTTRILAQITTPKPVIIGLSFGGIVAVEISKQIEVEKLLLISSVKTVSEIPFYFRWAGKWKFHRFLPLIFFKQATFIACWFFGIKHASDRQLLRQVIADTEPAFFKWAITRTVNWKNRILPGRFIHIHGTSDRIFPVKFISPDVRVKNGGHFMIFNRADELTDIINSN